MDSQDEQSSFFQEELNLPRVWTSLKHTLFANTLPRRRSPTASVCAEATPATRDEHSTFAVNRGTMTASEPPERSEQINYFISTSV